MITASVREARLHLSKYLQSLQSGEEVVIVKHRQPVARLVAFTGSGPRRFPKMAGLRRQIAAAHPGAWADADTTVDVRQDRDGRG